MVDSEDERRQAADEQQWGEEAEIVEGLRRQRRRRRGGAGEPDSSGTGTGSGSGAGAWPAQQQQGAGRPGEAELLQK